MNGMLSEACDEYPVGLTKSELERHAQKCGSDAALRYIKDETGIDVSQYTKDGKPDWGACAKALFERYTGVSTGDVEILTEDGDVNYEGICEIAGTVVASAVCTAVGAGAIAPLCGLAGSVLGKVVYNLASAAADLFKAIFGSDPKIIQPDAHNCVLLAQAYFLGQFNGASWIKNPTVDPRVYSMRYMAMRGLIVTTLGLVDKLQKSWEKLSGSDASIAEAYEMLVSEGFRMPRGVWRAYPQLLTADRNGGWQDGTGPENTRYRYTESMWAFLKTLVPPTERFWWDVYSRRVLEDPARQNDIQYRVNAFAEFEKLTPVFPIGGAEDSFSPEQLQALRSSTQYNSDEASCHWLILCGGSNPMSLAWVTWAGQAVFYPPYHGAGGLWKSTDTPKGHTVLYIKSDIDIDYWCGVVDEAKFNEMLTLWMQTLEAAVPRVLQRARKLKISTRTVSISNYNRQLVRASVIEATSTGKSSGSLLLGSALAVAALGVGYAIVREQRAK